MKTRVDRRGREVPDRFEAVGIGGMKVVEQEHGAVTGRRDLLDESHHPLERQQPEL